MIEDRDLRGQLRARYVRGPKIDEILLREGSDGAKLYPLADGLGSTVALTDAGGSVTHRYRYDAYGTPSVLNANRSPVATGLSAWLAHRFLFTGREWLGVAGLQDNRYRVYAAPLGRWLQVDPIGFAATGYNLTAYVSNGAPSQQDVFGLNPATIAIGSTLAGEISAAGMGATVTIGSLGYGTVVVAGAAAVVAVSGYGY